MEITLTRLPYRLPEFPPRVLWVSPAARETWAPRIAAVAAAWLEVERQSVGRVRPSALQSVTPEALPALIAAQAARGLVVLPLGRVGNGEGYQSAAQPVADGAWAYRCAITTPAHVSAWTSAWAAQDDAAIGTLLGTPACCQHFFQTYWSRERWMDTTVPSHPPTVPTHDLNGLLRWLGVRPVPHLPCRPSCPASKQMAEDLWPLYDDTTRPWARTLLRMPVQYSSLYGLAEIVTPIFRMTVPSDALAEEVVVRYLGDERPAESASGLAFPFATVPPRRQTVDLVPSDDPRMNGFSTVVAMRAAHDRLLAVLAGQTFGTVLDLGCGDGTLLRRIPARRRVGVESSPETAARARQRLDRVVDGDCAYPALVRRLIAEECPDLVIAQRYRNPPGTLTGTRVLSYSYEPDAPPPVLLTSACIDPVAVG